MMEIKRTSTILSYYLSFSIDSQDDSSLNEPGSTASWPLEPKNVPGDEGEKETQGWRHIRIKQNGKNASGQTHYLSISGFEIYGSVTGVCDDQLGVW